MFASVLSAAILGIEVRPVQVEADVINGLPSFTMVGFPSAQVKEAQDRVRTALKNNGFQFPPKKNHSKSGSCRYEERRSRI